MSRKTILIQFLIFISVCLLVSHQAYARKKIKITINTIPNAVIVLSDNPTEEERFAADELARYIKKMSKATLSIVYRDNHPLGKKPVIFVGNNLYLEQNNIIVDSDIEDAYLIKTMKDKTIVLLGNSGRATVYSVYHFLHKLGCRWIMPGKHGDVVPFKKTIKIKKGIHLLEIPDFELRHYKADGKIPALKPKSLKSVYHWMLKNRINRGFRKDMAMFNAYKGSFGHTYKKIIPQNMYLTNPEYFSLINGKRVKKGQRCTSNKEVIEATKRYVDDYFNNQKDAKIVSISPNDNGRWCECSQCLALDGKPNIIKGTTKEFQIYSGRVHRFASEIASHVKIRHPDKYAYVYAYSHYTPFPPPFKKNETFKVNDNLIVNLCYNLNSCDNRSITDSSNEISNWYRQNVVEPWTQKASHVWFHQYTYRWSAVEVIWPMWHVASKDMKYLYDKGVWGFFASGGKLNWGSNGLYYYIVARLMWDVDADVDQIISDYCKHFYKRAKTDMKKYYDHMASSVTSTHRVLRNYPGVIDYIAQVPEIYTEEVMAKGQTFLDSAFSAAPSKNIKRRIKMVKFSHQYTGRLMTFIKAYTISQNTKTPQYIQSAIDAGNSVLDLIKTEYVLWSISKKTANGYGAEEFVGGLVKKLQKQIK